MAVIDIAVTDGAWFKRVTLEDALQRIERDPSIWLQINGRDFRPAR